MYTAVSAQNQTINLKIKSIYHYLKTVMHLLLWRKLDPKNLCSFRALKLKKITILYWYYTFFDMKFIHVQMFIFKLLILISKKLLLHEELCSGMMWSRDESLRDTQNATPSKHFCRKRTERICLKRMSRKSFTEWNLGEIKASKWSRGRQSDYFRILYSFQRVSIMVMIANLLFAIKLWPRIYS